MPFMINADDRPGSAELRQKVRPDHLAFLVSRESQLIAAGAKLSDDGMVTHGSFYIIDTDDRAEAEAFIAADPYSQAGLFGTVRIERWRKAFFDFRRQAVSGT
jgi:uncharacterized protein